MSRVERSRGPVVRSKGRRACAAILARTSPARSSAEKKRNFHHFHRQPTEHLDHLMRSPLLQLEGRAQNTVASHNLLQAAL